MAQLVELISTDEAGLQALGELGDDRGARTDKADTGARKAILTSRQRPPRGPRCPPRGQRSKMLASSSVSSLQVVHAVGVVPEDAEIGRGRGHLGQATHGVLAKGDARGVGIRHAPDALDGIVGGNEALDFVHIGAVVGHRDGNVLDAQVGGDAKVAIVAGNRAQELDLLAVVRSLVSLPGLAAARAAAPEHAGDVVLDQQARRAQHECLLGGTTQELPASLRAEGMPSKQP